MDTYQPASGSSERDESPAERLDRNWSELLQELRVSQTGIQILSGFLVTLPFQARFAQLDPVLVGIFVAALSLATLSTILIVAPAAAHRVLFRRHAKDLLVGLANRLAKVGLVGLAVTVSMVVVLIVGFLAGTGTGLVAGVICLLVFGGLWLLLPWLLWRHREYAPPETEETPR